MTVFSFVSCCVSPLIILFMFLAIRKQKMMNKYLISLSNEQRKQLGALHDVLIEFPTDATTTFAERVQRIVDDLKDCQLERRQIDWHLNVSALNDQDTRVKKIAKCLRVIRDAARGIKPPNKID